jgi:DNA-directed RNA polymerase specialized sigma24 family protein
VYQIDVDICEIAGELWSSEGEYFATSTIGDPARGLDLMLEAAASVTRRRGSDPADEIKSLKSYLFKSFTRLILAEQKKSSGNVPIETEQRPSTSSEEQETGVVIATKPTQERDTYINEMKRQMGLIDERLPRVFELRAAGYTFEEIAPDYGMKSNVLRSWFSKKIAELKDGLESGS